MKPLFTLVLIAACAIPASASAEKRPQGTAADCPAAQALQQRHLLGHWQAELPGLGQRLQLQLTPHPELAESVRGSLQRGSQRSLLAGDVDGGTLTLEESDDGQRISATWLGDVVEGSCGREIRGQWQREGASAAPQRFILRKE
ncbi:MAG: hypothetical protein LWW82_01870 [Comamonadaceae bacterium]|jgi:hypothetical protein|nr:hypothetical protein [Comamonadaceae bacterium]